MHADNDAFATSTPVKIAAVCRRFRNVAVTAPKLWSYITFSSCYAEGPLHWEGDALYLARSRGASLDVNIEWDRRTQEEKEGRVFQQIDDDDDPDDEKHWISPADVERAIALLRPHVGRFRSFSVECEVYFPFHMLLTAFSHIPAPRLQWLELSCTRAFAESWRFEPTRFGDAPQLRAHRLGRVAAD